MRHLTVFLAFALFANLLPVTATTWDEPWMETVIADADALVRGVVVSGNSDSATVSVTRRIAGVDVPDTLVVDGFSLLQLTSASVAERLGFEANTELYLFLKQRRDGRHYMIATPTTGFAIIATGSVYATYRHSYHQTLVDVPVFEMSMGAIFRKVHGLPGSEDTIRAFIAEQLSAAPAVPDEKADRSTIARFFAQHVALESERYFNDGRIDRLEPFLTSKAMHVEASAVRALAGASTPAANERLVTFIESKADPFAKVVAIMSLAGRDLTAVRARLERYLPMAETEETGFGGNIMDPRVGTAFPESVKAALTELLGGE